MTVRETSVDAYHAVVDSGLVSAQRMVVFKWLYENGPATAGEAQQALWPVHRMRHVHPSLNHMVHMGAVRERGTRTCRVSGMNVTEYEIDGTHGVRPYQKPKDSKTDRLRARVAQLEAALTGVISSRGLTCTWDPPCNECRVCFAISVMARSDAP